MNTKYKVIDKSKCMTISELAKRLNESYPKKSGVKYTCSDIRKYIDRGKLPIKFGGNSLKEIRVDGTGIRYVEII